MEKEVAGNQNTLDKAGDVYSNLQNLRVRFNLFGSSNLEDSWLHEWEHPRETLIFLQELPKSCDHDLKSHPDPRTQYHEHDSATHDPRSPFSQFLYTKSPQATAIRQKELSEFNEEEKDLLQSISALKSAVTVLSKHNSLLQMPRSHVTGAAASVQNVMQKHACLLTGVLTHSERKAVAAFIQAS